MRKSVIISGAGSGIGRAIAIRLSELNFDCYLLGRNAVHLQKTLIALKDGDHYSLSADIKSKESLAACISTLRRPVDALVANAGIGGESAGGQPSVRSAGRPGIQGCPAAPCWECGCRQACRSCSAHWRSR